jgi:NAD(P)-dependent dehydrogenase (short-subunit alcohol dehydrogenase family)
MGQEETMQGLLAGKSALITGGGSGIGRATSLAFAREGARVAVADQSADNASATVQQINASGGQAISIALDVTDSAAVANMVSTTVAAFGQLDCAFNNAGISGVHVDAAGLKTVEWSEQSFDRMIEVNLKSVWLCMKQEILQMLKQDGGGSIVNTASILGLVGSQFSSAYVAAKHGVVGLTKAAALEYAENDIRVNAVCPGYITTPMTDDVMRRRGEQIMAKVAMNRMGTPEEIAEMVVWFCSDRASFVTGTAYNVDGGYVAA